MRYRNVAMVLVASACSACTPANEYAGNLPTADAAQTQTLLNDLVKSGCRTRKRPAGTAWTKVQICALVGANAQSGATAQSTGTIVGTLINTGTVADDRWSLQPATTSTPAVTYYLRIFPPRSGSEEGYYQIASYSASGWDAAKETGSFNHCPGPGHSPQARAHAGFATCAEGPPTDAEDPIEPSESLLPTDGPAWITCREGCCTTQQ